MRTGMKKRVLLTGLLLLPLLAIGQAGSARWSAHSLYRQMADFDGLYSEGPVPTDLQLSFEELYQLNLQRGKEVDKESLKEVSYQVSRLMANGQILFGDPITRYINEIADTLLRDYPGLRDSLRFYCVKSPAVNAFSTGQGMVFVNLGLVAQAGSEAEIAFVLGHEIAHYVREHTWQEMRSQKDVRIEERHKRSKEMETEADSLCVALFYGRTAYSKGVADGVFDMLQYAYLPFDEIPFDTSLFSSAYYHLPSLYYKEKVDPITSRDDYDDSKSTHPNLMKRRQAVGDLLKHHRGNRLYLVAGNADNFYAISYLAKLECMRQNLIAGDYTRAFYNAYVLERASPASEQGYVMQVMMESLYALAKHKTYAANNDAVEDARRVEGQEQQVVHLMRKIRPDELTMIALDFIWDNKDQGSFASHNQALVDDLYNDLFGKLGYKRSYFLNSHTAVADTQDNGDRQEYANSKYARIRQQRQTAENSDEKPYFFTERLECDTAFRNYFDRGPAVETITAFVGDRPNGKLLVLQPSYYVFNDRKEKLKVGKSDRNEQRLNKEVGRAASRLGIEAVDFSQRAIKGNSDVAVYNDYARLCEWTREHLNIDKNVVRIHAVDIAPVRTKYGADYVNVTTVSNTEGYGMNGALPLAMIVLPPFIPVLAMLGAEETQMTKAATLTVDMATGESVRTGDTWNIDYMKTNSALVHDNLAQVMGKRTGGFMGNRVMVTAGARLALSGIGRIWSREVPWIDLRPTLGVECAIGDDMSLYASAERSTCPYDLGDHNNWKASQMYDAETYTLMASCRYYPNPNFVPNGIYMGLGGTFSRIAFPSRPSQLTDDRYNRWGIALEFGQHYMLANRLALDYNVRYTATLAWALEPFAEDYMPADLTRIQQVALCRLNANQWTHNAIVFGLSLGFLPF